MSKSHFIKNLPNQCHISIHTIIKVAQIYKHLHIIIQQLTPKNIYLWTILNHHHISTTMESSTKCEIIKQTLNENITCFTIYLVLRQIMHITHFQEIFVFHSIFKFSLQFICQIKFYSMCTSQIYMLQTTDMWICWLVFNKN